MFFPLYPSQAFPLGTPIELVLGVDNIGQTKTFNITYIGGSLRHNQEPTQVLQNFSFLSYGEVVRPGRSVSFPWWFFPDHMLEPAAYFLVVQVEYTDDSNINYTSLGFNGTVHMVDTDQTSIFSLFTYLITLILAGLGGYYYFKKGSGSGTPFASISIFKNLASEPKKATSVGTGKVDSWTSNATMDQWRKQQEQAKKTSVKSSK